MKHLAGPILILGALAIFVFAPSGTFTFHGSCEWWEPGAMLAGILFGIFVGVAAAVLVIFIGAVLVVWLMDRIV